MSEQELTPENPCTICMKHSGIEMKLEYQDKWLGLLSKRVNAIIMLLITDLVLLVIFLIINGLPKGG